jgi:hypothetical protein
MTPFDVHTVFMKLQILILELLRNEGHCMADCSCVELARVNSVLTDIPHSFVQAVISRNSSSSIRHTTSFK